MVLGLVCRVPGGHPHVVGISLERSEGGLIAKQVLEHRPIRHASWPGKLSLIRGELETLLLDAQFDAIVVKTIEARTPVGAPRLTDANRQRLQLEGVMLVVADAHADTVKAMTGQELGTLLGTSKAEVEREAAALIGDHEVRVEATSAALGALALSERGG